MGRSMPESKTVRNAVIAITVVVVFVILIWVFLTLIYPTTLKGRSGPLQVEIDCTNLILECEGVSLTGDVSWNGDVGAWSNTVASFPKEWLGEECKVFTITATHGSGGMTKTTTLCDGKTERIVVSV